MALSQFLGGVGLVSGLLCLAGLVTSGAAQQIGKGKLPDDVKLEADIPYGGTDNSRQRLNLLLPKTAKGDHPLPVIVYIHGGAWLGGSRTAGHSRLAGFVSNGEYAGAAIGYRLTGEAI